MFFPLNKIASADEGYALGKNNCVISSKSYAALTSDTIRLSFFLSSDFDNSV